MQDITIIPNFLEPAAWRNLRKELEGQRHHLVDVNALGNRYRRALSGEQLAVVLGEKQREKLSAAVGEDVSRLVPRYWDSVVRDQDCPPLEVHNDVTPELEGRRYAVAYYVHELMPEGGEFIAFNDPRGEQMVAVIPTFPNTAVVFPVNVTSYHYVARVKKGYRHAIVGWLNLPGYATPAANTKIVDQGGETFKFSKLPLA